MQINILTYPHLKKSTFIKNYKLTLVCNIKVIVIVPGFEIYMWIFQFSSWHLGLPIWESFLYSFIASGIHKSISLSFTEQKLSQFHIVNGRMKYDVEKFLSILT